MYTAILIPQVSKVFCNRGYMCSWMQNSEIRTFKMLQKSFLWLIKAWNWVSSRAAGRIRLLGTVNSYTHKITPHTELPNPLVPHCHTQLGDCPVELSCGCFHPLCVLSALTMRSEFITVLCAAKVKTIFSSTDNTTSSVTKDQTSLNMPFPFCILIQGVLCLGLWYIFLYLASPKINILRIWKYPILWYVYILASLLISFLLTIVVSCGVFTFSFEAVLGYVTDGKLIWQSLVVR